MKDKTKQDWRRNGTRVNLYFDDPKILLRLDRAAKHAGVNRSKMVQQMLDQHTQATA